MYDTASTLDSEDSVIEQCFELPVLSTSFGVKCDDYMAKLLGLTRPFLTSDKQQNHQLS